jgi:hypothetical protein
VVDGKVKRGLDGLGDVGPLPVRDLTGQRRDDDLALLVVLAVVLAAALTATALLRRSRVAFLTGKPDVPLLGKSR